MNIRPMSTAAFVRFRGQADDPTFSPVVNAVFTEMTRRFGTDRAELAAKFQEYKDNDLPDTSALHFLHMHLARQVDTSDSPFGRPELDFNYAALENDNDFPTTSMGENGGY